MKQILKCSGIKYEKAPLDLIIQYNLTYDCNYKCTYCDYVHNHKKENLPIEKHYELLDYIKSINMPKKITIIGGEPTIYKDFNKLLLYTKENLDNSLIMVFSNGSQYIKSFEKSLQYIPKDFIYLFTIHPYKCDLNGFMEKIKLLKENKIQYKIFIMMEKDSLDWVKRCVNLLNNKELLIQNHRKWKHSLECTFIQPIEQQCYNDEEIDYAKSINQKDDSSSTETDYFYDIIDDNGNITRENYTMAEMRLIDNNFYFKFTNMWCKAYSQLRIEPNGIIATRCDRYFDFINPGDCQNMVLDFFKDSEEKRQQFIKKINEGVICTRHLCPERCDLLLIPKERQ